METRAAGVPDSKSAQVRVAGRRHPTSTDFVLLQAVRMALRLVDGDGGVLQRARARVLRGAAERPTAITERALVTLDLARRTGTVR